MSSIQYEYIDESSIDENYKCLICNEPFQHPVTTPCDHSYCQECIEHWLDEGYSTCPACRQPTSINNLKPITTRLVLNILDRLQVKCLECGQCGIQRGNFNDHIAKICPKGTILCSASDIKCPWSGQRDQLQEHLINCSYEKLRSVLDCLINTNRTLEDQIQILSSQVQILQTAVQKPSRRLITFNKLFNIDKKIDSGTLSESYEGLRWINVWYMHEQWIKANHAQSGWENAFTNGHVCIVFNGKGNPMSISTKRQGKGTFSLISFEATAAWLDNLRVNLIGRRAKENLYSTTVILQYDASQVFNLDWNEIDEIEFIPINGTSHPGVEYTEKYFALTWILID
ncbi:unnamed protein product [Rotaria magnacalcarata]|uniref:RING-type domain-containing protein n=1 Tax=Rotaria magnacalcarata TaxID=392030 RepID=A0A816ZUI9_9BILA|nr:unnamed protein product [Rotaria magnacalcarata]CAF1303568.1 unnamed protein product [Rotaria magnacalcarata]CAF2143001.1 unnamed protein product [Rotaria magnacalcarata]CAF2211970.1 unnamed protein product [Rotaria magnacalcarata]CAF2220472.1 unnamed protein product [Rotaria magnacalcarata]